MDVVEFAFPHSETLKGEATPARFVMTEPDRFLSLPETVCWPRCFVEREISLLDELSEGCMDLHMICPSTDMGSAEVYRRSL